MCKRGINHVAPMTCLAFLLSFAVSAQAATLHVTVSQYSSKTGPYFRDAAKAFEKTHPDDKIDIQVVPWDSLHQKLTTDISARRAPDLSIIGTRWLADFVKSGLVEPLNQYMQPEFKSRFFPVFLNRTKMDGKIYGLPVAASVRGMYYNKDLFNKAGIKNPPDTWHQLASDAKKISALGKNVHGFGLQGDRIETDVYYYYAFWAYGGSLLNKEGKSGLDSEAGVKAAKLYKQMIDNGSTEPGVTSNTREDVQNLFKQGKVAMVMTQPFLINQIQDQAPNLNYGIASIPAGPGGERGTYGVTDSIVMFKSSQHKKLAWQFLDMLFQKKWRNRFTSGEGFLPVNKAVAQEPKFANDARLKKFTRQIPSARFAPIIAGWTQVADITSNALQSIYLGNGKIKPTLSQAADRINRILAKNN